MADYETKKLDELKALCKERGLKVGGTKPDLVARLEEDDAKGGGSGSDEGESKKRKSDAGPKPKGAKSAYIFFSTARGAEIRADPEHKGKSVGEVSKIVGAEWKAMSDDAKKPYDVQAKADKARATAELDAWKAAGGVEEPKKKKKAAAKKKTKN